jgi:hypothetical protein
MSATLSFEPSLNRATSLPPASMTVIPFPSFAAQYAAFGARTISGRLVPGGLKERLNGFSAPSVAVLILPSLSLIVYTNEFGPSPSKTLTVPLKTESTEIDKTEGVCLFLEHEHNKAKQSISKTRGLNQNLIANLLEGAITKWFLQVIIRVNRLTASEIVKVSCGCASGVKMQCNVAKHMPPS